VESLTLEAQVEVEVKSWHILMMGNREGLGMVAHTCNPSYLEGKDRRIIV
jgi:hypothetical protein